MEIIKKLLTPNRYSRPQKKNKPKAVVIHWIANPNTSASMNRNWFESLKNQTKTFASAHYIIGLKGEIIQCLTESEIGYHVGSKSYTKEALEKLGTYPNSYTIGIELCHKDWTGEFNNKTLQSAKELVADICIRYGFDPFEDIYTHHEIVGWKDCPRWFVNNPKEFDKFKQDVFDIIENKKFKDYQQLLKENTDMPLQWIDVVTHLKNGYLELDDVKRLKWLKDLIEKVSKQNYKKVLNAKTSAPNKWIKVVDSLKKGNIKIDHIEILFWLKELIEKIGN